MVRPGASHYDTMKAKFEAEVSGPDAQSILSFLYSFERHLKDDFALFSLNYEALYPEGDWRWAEIRANYPRLYQPTISFILTGKYSDTITSYRLEDLERIGLVARSDVPVPKPKSVMITPAGIHVIEAAIEGAVASLAPIFELPADLKQPQPPVSRSTLHEPRPNVATETDGEGDRGEPPAVPPK